jgi:hypothetical protein
MNASEMGIIYFFLFLVVDLSIPGLPIYYQYHAYYLNYLSRNKLELSPLILIIYFTFHKLKALI